MRTGRAILIGAGVVLAFAVAAAFRPEASRRSAARTPIGLATRLPERVEGASVENLPVGPTEYVAAQTLSKMDYDEVVHRSYASARGTFTVYAGYWGPGRVAPSHVGAHIPDRCWTLAGMTCRELRAQTSVHPALAPGNWRRFRTSDGQEIETVFWHLVGSASRDYGARPPEERGLLARALAVSGDLFSEHDAQVFVRINSPAPLRTLLGDPAFEAVARSLAELGLRPGV
jgi:hypothetical protein